MRRVERGEHLMGRYLVAMAALCVALVLAAGGAWAADKDDSVLFYDFEQGADLSLYEGINPRKDIARVVPRPDGEGHCLEITTKAPSRYCGPMIDVPFTVDTNMVLVFDHREKIVDGKAGYLGVSLYDADKQYWTSDRRFSDQWKTHQVQLGGTKAAGKFKGYVHKGTQLRRIQLYGRAENQPKTTARMTVYLDNIRVYVDKNLAPGISKEERISYSAVPLFDWQAEERGAPQRLQYSMDKMFRDASTVTVEIGTNYYSPPKPLKPGTWYYRHWIGKKAGGEWEGVWAEASRVIIPERCHRYVAPPVPYDALIARAHPRLLPMALLDREKPDATEIARLKRASKKLYKRPIPEHPGPFNREKPDPRWPEWIDWYGKVAGGITAGTGSRLTSLGTNAVLTGDPEIIQWAKEKALEACKWDPKGGSAMRYGDLQAASFLRGMTWCYDASCNTMTPEERKKVRDILIERAEQFFDPLCPCRVNEAQNHSWNKATVLARTALVLLDEYKYARDWMEVCLKVYAYRFLPSMGFQGENQEGLPYWSYGGGIIVRYTELMRFGCDVNLYDHPWLAQTGRFPIYCAPPGAYFVCFADGGAPNHDHKGPYGTSLAKLLGRRTGDPYQLWYGGATDWPSGPGAKPPVDIPQSMFYPHIGWVIFNTNLVDGREGVTVAMHSGKYFAGHQHADLNHFVINAYGDKLAIDGGYYDYYGSPHFKDYSVHTQAHNSILVNGQGQVWRKKGIDGKVDDYYDSPAYGYTVGNASHPGIYEGALKRFDRRFVFIKPRFLVTQDLIASAKGPAEFDWLMHSHTDLPFQVDDAADTFKITRPLAQLQGALLAPAEMGLTLKKAFDILPRGKRSSQFLDEKDVQPEWTMHAIPVVKSEKQEFVVAMHIQRVTDGKAEADADMEYLDASNGHGVHLSYGDATHLIVLRKQDATGALAFKGLGTDGDVAAVELDSKGKVQRAFAANATRVTYEGKTLHKSKKPADWSMDGLPEPAQRPIKGAKVEIDGKKQPLDGYEIVGPESTIRTWWCHVPSSGISRARITLRGWKGDAPPAVSLNNSLLTPRGAKGISFATTLREGVQTVTITGHGTLKGMTVTTSGDQAVVDALAMPTEFAPTTGSIVIEAEKPARESVLKGKIWEKVGASGGLANCAWQDNGLWAEWDFDVPATGHYNLYIRHCTVYDDVVREFLIDDEPVVGQSSVRRLHNTGGWCRTENDWRYMGITDADGKVATICLEDGKHTLRMDYVNGASNTDCFVLVPAAD